MSELLGFRITLIHAFIAVADDKDEGITGFLDRSGMWMPMIAADPKRLELLRPKAQEIATASGRKIWVARFAHREDIELIEPR